MSPSPRFGFDIAPVGSPGPGWAEDIVDAFDAIEADAARNDGGLDLAGVVDGRFASAKPASSFTAAFEFEKIASNQDGYFTAVLNIDAGDGDTPTYFKGVGFQIDHTGPGNLDVFWASVQHHGAREAGLFIGDLTADGGGDAYGIHTRVGVETNAPYGILVGYVNEIVPNVARPGGIPYYAHLIQNSGDHNASAAIEIESPGFGGGGKFDVGINFDSTVANASGTAMIIGGSWGAGINMNGNSIVGAGTVAGGGSSPNRDVRIADNLVIDNARHIKFKNAAGTATKAIGATSSDNLRLKLVAVGAQFEFYNADESELLARITSSGRGDFGVGGVTSKYTAGAGQPGYLTNGHVEVWHDSGSGNDYLVVHSGGASKKVLVA